MGGWVLEIGKMALYMSFPVAMFHYFNQPEYFEKWVTQKKQELYPPAEQSHHEEIQNAIKEQRLKHELDRLKKLDATQ